MREEPYCFWHSPAHAQEATEARRLGGLRRKREMAVSGAYELHGLTAVQDVRRLLEIAVLDALALENGVARCRTLAYLAQVALKAMEVGELESRLASLETAVRGNTGRAQDAVRRQPHGWGRVLPGRGLAVSYTKRRVVGLQKALGPQQAVLLWMEEAHRFPNAGEYAKSLLGQPLSAYPNQRLRDQAASAARASLRGERREAVERAEELAQRDALFLFSLQQQVNHKVADEQRENALELLFLIERLNAVVWGHAVRIPPPQGGVAEEVNGAPGGAGACKPAAQWAEWAGRLLRDLISLHSAAAALGERYSGGRQVLFRESAEAHCWSG